MPLGSDGDKDVPDYLGEVTMQHMEGAQAGAEALEQQRSRHRSFLKRKRQTETDAKAWRPKKRFRKSSWQWLCALHHQMSQFHGSGLLHFCVPDELELRLAPICWPRLSLTPDQGSDGVSALCFALHRLGACIDVQFDPSHGVWNDLLGGIKAARLFEHLLLSMLRLNVPVGPWAEDMRFKQGAQGLQELLTYESHDKCPLYQHFLGDMLSELAAADLAGEEDASALLWERLRSNNPFSVKGTKVCLGRFMDFLRKSKSELEHWHQRKFLYLHTCLELDMLHGASFVRLAIGDHKLAKTTDSRRESAEEAALRKACCNQMVLAAMFMLDPDSLMIEKLLVVATEAWEQWHSAQNRALRSCLESLPWLQAELRGGWMSAAKACLQTTMLELPLGRCGFSLPRAGWSAPSEPGFLLREDDMAQRMVHLVMGVTYMRLKRCSPMLFGWGSRSSLFLLGGEEAQRELDLFLRDFECYQRFKQEAGQFGGLREVVERSALGHVANQQLHGVLQSGGFSLERPDMRRFLTSCHSRILGSQVCEDAFNVQKNSAPTPWQNRMGSIEESFRTLLEHSPLADKHRYDEVRLATDPVARDVALPREVFRARPASMPAEFRPLTSFKDKTEWPTCKAEDWGLAFAEQVVMCRACDRNELSFVENSWLGALAQASHDIIVRQITAGTPGQWMFPLGQLGTGPVFMWPAVEVTLGAATDKVCYRFDLSIDSTKVRDLAQCVWSLPDWQARSISGKSPAWQAAECLDTGGQEFLHPWTLAAFLAGPVDSLLGVACKCGFWQLQKPFLSRLSRHVGADPESEELLALSEAVIRKATSASASEALDMMAKRLSTSEGVPNTSIQDFLDVEDCLLYVDKKEVEDLSKMASQVKGRVERASTFKEAWVKRHREVRPAAPEAKRKKAASGGAGWRAAAQAPRVLPRGELTQAMLKPLVPPGGSIWRGNTAGCWQSHMSGFPRCSRSWHLWGHRRAAVLVLRNVWEMGSCWRARASTSAQFKVCLRRAQSRTSCLRRARLAARPPQRSVAYHSIHWAGPSVCYLFVLKARPTEIQRPHERQLFLPIS